MLITQAYCPASISLIFKVCLSKNIYKTGSIGVGFTVDKGVKVTVKKSKRTTIIFNKKHIKLPSVEMVIKELTSQDILVELESDLPLSYGFGLSGASSLATSFALGRFLTINLSPFKLAQIAHRADIINYTGLGSVGTQFTGGFLVKKSPGLPFKAYRLPFIGRKIYAVVIDKLKTSTVLKNRAILPGINRAADHALKKINQTKNISLEEILDISYQYAKKSNLITDKKITFLIDNIKKDGGQASQAMLGKVIISDKMPEVGKDYIIEELTITNDKPELIIKA